MALNHYAINKIIGGRMVAGGRNRFGHLSLLGVVGNALKHRPCKETTKSFDLEDDTAILRAFRAVSGGRSPEDLVIRESLARKFHAEARRRGVEATAAQLNRRLINIRKNPARYRELGLVIPKAKKHPNDDVADWKYAHVVEFALSKLRLRYNVSIDDIVLIDPALRREFDSIVKVGAPELDPLAARLMALYIRKSRFIQKNKEKFIDSLRSDKIQAEFTHLGTIDGLDPKDAPKSEGLIEIVEDNRYLYISQNANLHESVEQIVSPQSLQMISNDFWQPDPKRIDIRVLPGNEFMHVSFNDWQKKLIAEEKPVFNYSVAA